ncbi:putative immunoglobulin-blocking virulence protein [Mycoplasma sp. CSL7503-lung]|uniref:putative immunoglobulin-blocking virulence protein n=1 Tax=Mycoplasma sp. CSL7503-lung TaxID=536372 RepID=UPI0021D2FF06|nr:putative immunoglobulin-blocking virulence protein [Mycoplasma sp. CSL7503-lung]MCU4706534.1 putative immunoglobulin-blocking virulence protein [Mycoplasma sp. CSL7503-lung]
MHFLKLKKNKINVAIIISSLAISTSLAAGVYNFSSGKNSNEYEFKIENTRPKLINKNNLDIVRGETSIIDDNLKEIPQPKPIEEPKPEPIKEKEIIKNEINPKREKIAPKPIPKPIEKPKIITPKPIPKPIEKPESKPVEQPSPIVKVVPEPVPEEVKDPEPSPSDNRAVIDGVRVRVKREFPKEPVVEEYDINNKLNNRIKYIDLIGTKITSIEATEELRKAQVTKATDFLFTNKSLFKAHIEDYKQIVKQTEQTGKTWDWELYFSRPSNQNTFSKFEDRFGLLFDPKNEKNFVNFLTEQGQREWPEHKKLYEGKPYEKIKYERLLWLMSNLDQTKLTKISNDVENLFKEGHTLGAEGSYINEKGEISSHIGAVPDGHNQTLNRYYRDNIEKRAFGYNDWMWRTGGQIKDGLYPGWEKRNIKSDPKFQKYNIQNIDGIEIYELTRTNNDPAIKREKGTVVSIDASDDRAYEKTKSLIEELTEDKVEITSYRILNMGQKSAGQKFKDILKALPKKLPQLELFFDAAASNTSSLIELEDKEIDELSLYTEGNSLKEEWNLNPLSFRNVAWVNSIDYNVGFDYKPGSKLATRLVFNTISFDKGDLIENAPNDVAKFKRINDGLRLVYWARHHEPFFSSGDYSYPMNLDFSRVPQIRSLKNLVFTDIVHPEKPQRRLRKVNLFNTGSYFDIYANELNDAGFSKNMVIGEPGPPETKITFSNNNETQYVYIKGNTTLSTSGINELRTLISLGKLKNTIKVDKENIALIEQLKANGYEVVDSDETWEFS